MVRKVRLFGFVILSALLGLVWSRPSEAAVPGTLTQQGRLLDSVGMPVSGAVALVFTVYDAATAGTSLWTESQTITLEDGYFSARLGDMTPIPATVFTGVIRYLAVKVATDAEMTPRQPITSVPYALLAGEASHSAKADAATSATTAATATNMAFTGLTGIPAPCAAGSYLKGYDASGVAQCAVLPALGCSIRSGEVAALNGATYQACAAGEVMTGGGCYSSIGVKFDYPYRCAGLCFCLIGSVCPTSPSWYCASGDGSTAPTAYAICCSVK